ncbi:putative toxin-antitoxin system toxin component, PIN family [Parvularcula oceani]|uniref:putative toxin-antitoxin system toxin component, PIN family n=1 Tax=Parvularcula oceani TaxID=1247963 RepID=UPI0004E10DE6|nr:putative toxin-antitoxin system toxin component, PIN family [Parvularcula oceani]
MRVVLDTNVFVSAILSADGAPRQVLRQALVGEVVPVFGNALFAEYEDVLGREAVFRASPIAPRERERLLDALLSVAVWVRVYYLWRPNLPDEADNHLIELAVAGSASTIIAGNTRDVAGGTLRFKGLSVLTPARFLKEKRP